ncbi:hypothetical protein ACB092_08G113100 [Castanea dentata]
MVGDRKRNRKEANMGKGSKASTSKDHDEDIATTLEAKSKNKKRKCVVDNGRATSNPKPKEYAEPKSLQSTPESRIYAYELPKKPPVQSNIDSLVKNNEYSTPFEKQLQENDIKQHYRLFLSQKAVRKFLFPLLKDEELRGFVRQGIPVTAYDVQGNAFPMEFKQTSCKNKYHILTQGWAEFCDEHGLRALKDFVTLWMFRHKETDRLCFVISLRTIDDLDHGIKPRPINN